MIKKYYIGIYKRFQFTKIFPMCYIVYSSRLLVSYTLRNFPRSHFGKLRNSIIHFDVSFHLANAESLLFQLLPKWLIVFWNVCDRNFHAISHSSMIHYTASFICLHVSLYIPGLKEPWFVWKLTSSLWCALIRNIGDKKSKTGKNRFVSNLLHCF